MSCPSFASVFVLGGTKITMAEPFTRCCHDRVWSPFHNCYVLLVKRQKCISKVQPANEHTASWRCRSILLVRFSVFFRYISNREWVGMCRLETAQIKTPRTISVPPFRGHTLWGMAWCGCQSLPYGVQVELRRDDFDYGNVPQLAVATVRRNHLPL